MELYKDPENKDEIIEKLCGIADKKEFQEYVDQILPNWLIYTADDYSVDYPILRENWVKICQMNNVRPQKIVLVYDISFESDYQVLQKCCEIMTQRGYVIRRSSEFILCHVCHAVIPCKKVWECIKGGKPKKWLEKCSTH